MPACNLQCRDDTTAECGPCQHRDKSYPWPGRVDESFKVMVVKFNINEFGEGIRKVTCLTKCGVRRSEALLAEEYHRYCNVWSHWE